MRFNHVPWIVFSGVVWLGVGCMLLSMGLKFLMATVYLPAYDGFSAVEMFSPLAGGREQGALMLVICALTIGFLKGRLVLAKTVRRVVARILSLPTPVKISQVYSKGYIALLGSMVLLGMSLKFFSVPLEIRGFVDIAIGSALINGALLYFRAASDVHRKSKVS